MSRLNFLAVLGNHSCENTFRQLDPRLQVFRLLRSLRAFGRRDSAGHSSAHILQTNPVTIPFRVKHTANSCAIFSPGAGIRLLQAATSLGLVDIELTTQYLDGWGSIEYPVLAVTQGVAPNGGDVNGALRPLLEDLLAIVSVGANAWVGSFGTRCEKTSESNDSAVCVRSSDTSTLEVREMSEAATGALLDHISGHPSAKALWKAAHFYRQALAYWIPEQQPIALVHLHDGLLTMSNVMTRFLCEARGLTASELASETRIPTQGLSAHVLRSELYQEDTECFRAAEAAWRRANSQAQSAEDEIYATDDAHVMAARYLRSSIVRVAELEERHRSTLLSRPYDIPIGTGHEAEPHGAERELGARRRSLAREQFDIRRSARA
jgi:hypothetical protein